jgi:hypothetical protein
MAVILKGLQGLFMLFLHISKRNEVGYHNLFFNIVYIPLGIILISLAAVSNWIIVPTLIVIGLIVSLTFDKMMRASVGEEKVEVLDEDQSPEEPNETVLRFEIVNAQSPSTQTLSGFRERMIERAEGRLSRNLGRDFLVMVIYFALTAVWYFAGLSVSHPGFSKAVPNIGWGILASIVIRWLFMGKLYRPVDSESKRFLLQHPFRIYGEELASFLHKGGTNLVIAVLLASSIFSSALAGDLLSAVGLIIVGVIHYYALTKMKQSTEGNIKLLLLRTFDIRKNSTLTFGRLLNYWQHIGNYFTVVDVSYLKHKYRVFSRRTLGVIFIVALLAALLDLGTGQKLSPGFPFISIPSAIAVLLLVMAFEFYQVRRGFIQSRKTIRERIDKMEKRPRGLGDGMFMGVATMCHANTWRGTVAEMVSKASIVMMDLRGFKQGKDGCKWELNFLLDNFPVNSLLLLIDEKDDMNFIQNTMQELWQTLRDNKTGNRQMSNPTIRIYRVSKQDETDVQGIFDQLIGVACTSGRAEAILA